MKGSKSVLVAVFAVAVCWVLALGATPASALLTYSFAGDLEASPAFGHLEASSVAVDDSNGDTYVADSGSGAVDVFETSSGTQLASLDGSLTPAGSFGGGQVQVAANNSTGDVYVLDSTDNVVDVFDPAGGYVCQITGSSTPSASECNGVAGSDTPAHGFSTPGGITVDQATGDIYVVDAHDGVVDVFSAGGAYLRQISLASVEYGFSATYTRGIAVDDFNGAVYVSDSGPEVVYVFNAAGEWVTTWTGTPSEHFSAYVSVAAYNASGEVYVTDAGHHVTDVFGPAGEYRAQISESAVDGRGTAIDQANGNLYVSDVASSAVFVFAAKFVPEVTTGTASNVQPTGVTLNGTVNPDGVPVTACFFEYGTEASYGQSVPCAQSPEGGSAAVPVSADLSGLEEGVTYHFRLVAENANGANQGADEEVTAPAPPSIDSAVADDIVSGSADLNAAINPHGATTSYRFEYGTSAAYGASIPVPDGSVSAGLSDRTVTQRISGLQANATYHWRVIAQNLAGTTTGSDHTFRYDTTGEGLPDNRAYEMVTPPQKNGARIGAVFEGLGFDVAEDGSRLIASSLQCFAEAGACTSSRGTAGSAFEFSRTQGGWVASAPAPPATQYAASSYRGFSADAGTVFFSASAPPAGQDDLVGRRSDGSLLDLGPLTPPSAGAQDEGFGGIAATADLSHVVFGMNYKWPFDATQGELTKSLYEYVGTGNTEPVLVGVSGGPGSTDLISACETALAGRSPGNSAFYNPMSADGRTVFFTALALGGVGGKEPCPSGSGVNAGVPVPADTLYARIDESRTVLISGRSPAGCTSQACLSSAPGNATFQGASTDGSRVYFTSPQQLTDDASEGAENLYEYDFSRPTGENLVAVSVRDTSGSGPGLHGVVAISADGSHAYFVAGGVLTSVANSQGQVASAGAENLYMFERNASHPRGEVTFITSLPTSDEDEEFTIGEESYQAFVDGLGLANVTPDGRFLVFMSHGRLTADDTSTSGEAQVFRYDAQTGALVRISIGERGFNDNGNSGRGQASIVPAVSSITARAGGIRPDPTMSHDGSFVFFESPIGLTPRALNDVSIGRFGGRQEYAKNVYEWHEGHVFLISDGRDTSVLAPPGQGYLPTEGVSAVALVGSDATGANVFFSTSDRLVGRDIDSELDYYDARVCTAADPCISGAAPSVPSCTGEGCRGAPSAPPSLAAPLSAAFAGGGNLAVSVRSPMKVKKKVKIKRRKKGAKAKGKRKVKRGRHRVVGGRGKVKGSSGSIRRSR